MTPHTPRPHPYGSGTPILLARMMMIVIAAASSMSVLLSGTPSVDSAPLGREQSGDNEFRDTGRGAEGWSAILPDIPADDHPQATATERGCDMPDPNGASRADEAYDRYYRLLSFIATRTFAIPQDDVAPLAHDAFVAFFRNRDRIRNDAAWLVGVMYNLCREYWRTKGHEERARLTYTSALPKPFDTASARVDLERALRELPGRSVVAIRLRFFEGLSIDEVAANLGVTPDNAKQIIHRGLTKVRARFHERGGA